MEEREMSLLDWVRNPYERTCRKHELAPDAQRYADDHINAMTNVELVQAVSDALDEMIAARKRA